MVGECPWKEGGGEGCEEAGVGGAESEADEPAGWVLEGCVGERDWGGRGEAVGRRRR